MHVRPDALDLLLDFPGLGVDDHNTAGGRGGVQDRQIELGAVHGEHHVERVGIFAHPQRILDVRDFLPVAQVGIARIENRAIVLAQIVHHAEKAPVGGESDLVARREDLVERHLPVIVIDLLDRILVGCVLVELQ